MVITGTQAKAADRYAIDVLGIPSLSLMEKASFYIADYVINNHNGAKVLIISGTGNNGADGICIGRMLQENGFLPVVICCGNIWKATWEFYSQLADFKRLGGKIIPYSENMADLPDADVLIDAVFGIGLKREVQGSFKTLIEKMNAHRSIKISVDIPSGINSDTGDEMGISFKADQTFTFGRNKTGLVTGEGVKEAGKIVVCDIGIPEDVYRKVYNGCIG